MDPEDASRQIKQRTISVLLEEIQKLQLTIQLVVSRKCLEDKQVNASFVLEEFLLLNSFPRKVGWQRGLLRFTANFLTHITSLTNLKLKKRQAI